MNEKSASVKYILYLDTSEPEATIAIFDGEKKITQETWTAHRELSKTLSGKYLEILNKAGISQSDLSGLCVFVGPGSFTGLRIGISFVNALAFVLAIPVYGTRERGVLDLSNPQEIVTPFYGEEPKITKPKEK